MTTATRRRRRTRPGRRLLEHDRALGARLVGGADEAGRGSLAGPLVVAAVCLDTEALRGRRCAPLGELNDSKKHTRERRERLFGAVLRCATSVVVRVAPAVVIDRDGLHRTNVRLLGEALCALEPAPDVCLTDGFPVPGCPRCPRAVVDGDEQSAAIAAASIVAKVTRDRYMRRMASSYPEFGFDTHVGYITPDHVQAVRAHGVTPLHRLSFMSRAYDQLELAI